MMKRRSRDILFYIENEVQFDSLKPLLIHLRDRTKVSFDIVVPDDISESTIVNKEIHEGGAKALRENGFDIIRSTDDIIMSEIAINTEYKILISAYMYDWHYQNVNAKYYIMFPYASYYFNKPHWTVDRFIDQDYLADALFSHAVGTKPVTDIFTNTYIVPSLKLMGFHKKSKHSKKPVLFFAPTYNEINFAVNFLQNIDEIKKKYTVIMRGHHRVSHMENNKDLSERLYEKADRIYDTDEHSVIEPLEEADIVISDNSAIIFDAIYCDVPVGLFSQNPNSFHYRDINTTQSELVKNGEILWTDDPNEIVHIADETLTTKMLNKQKEMRHRLFPEKMSTDPIKQWIDVLSIYLEDRLPYEYKLAKRYWVERVNQHLQSAQAMRVEIEDLNIQIQNRDIIIHNEQNPGIKTSLRRLAKAFQRKFYIAPKQRIKYILRLPYRKFRIKFLKDPIIIYQFIFTEPESINFGDELTKDIIERLFNKKVEVHNEIDTRFDMLGVGSLIHFFNDITDYRTYVWGSGLIDDEVKFINNNFIFKACRGGYTRAKLAKKYNNIPLGDPGLLCNLIYLNKVEKTDKVGVIPHFRDEHSHYLNDIIKKHPEIFKIISVAQAPEKVADEIKSCKLVLSSSLHGLIVSDSFGVPNMHLMLSDNLKSSNHLRGGEYKFRDYYSGVGRDYENFDPRRKNLLDLSEYDEIIKRYKPLNNLKEIQKSLIKSFPY